MFERKGAPGVSGALRGLRILRIGSALVPRLITSFPLTVAFVFLLDVLWFNHCKAALEQYVSLKYT